MAERVALTVANHLFFRRGIEYNTPVIKILLLACYELGHQPFSLASPLAALAEANVPASAVDLAISPFPTDEAAEADFVGIAVPMHTALRLGVDAAKRVRQLNPDATICFYGLYAWLNAEHLFAQGADFVIAGEVETPLVELIQQLASPSAEIGTKIAGVASAEAPNAPCLQRIKFLTPLRSSLPPLNKYARYSANGQNLLAGYTEASRGCLHTCSHCPVVPIYNGRFFVVPHEVVLADIRQQVEAGARHITFGDPDFLNGPGHARRIVQAMHAEFPHVTFDFTAKVEHILEHAELFPEFSASGLTFLVSAFESVEDAVLERLGKGHSAEDLDRALAILQDAGVAVQPTWMPFTPWPSLSGYIALLRWIRERNLIVHVPAVQLAVRMLVPPHSALLDHPDADSWRGELEPQNFGYRWRHPDPRMDALHSAVTAIAEAGGDAYGMFAAIERTAYVLDGREPPLWMPPPLIELAPPRLTEDWFC